VKVSRALPSVGLLVGLLGSCGGTTRNHTDNLAGAAGASSSNGGSGNGVAGAGTKGGNGTGGSSNHPSGGVASAGEPSNGGVGGKIPEPITQGGDTGPTTFHCDQPYAGPSGGPRADGPRSAASCDSISDALILARYKDFGARVPMGLYYEPAESSEIWGAPGAMAMASSQTPCSASLADTVKRATAEQLGTLEGQYTTDWFYEAAYCKNGMRDLYRNLRCDYFDGEKLVPPTDDNMVFLSSLLWWIDNHNVYGGALIGYSVTVGNATDRIELCTISSTQGDFGLCDEVRLESTTHLLVFDGQVTLGTPKVVKTLKGDCH
jgi:hypothetical protein